MIQEEGGAHDGGHTGDREETSQISGHPDHAESKGGGGCQDRGRSRRSNDWAYLLRPPVEYIARPTSVVKASAAPCFGCSY